MDILKAWCPILTATGLKLRSESGNHYYQQKDQYYATIRKIGLDYDQLNYNQSLDFLLMTAQSLATGDENDNRNS